MFFDPGNLSSSDPSIFPDRPPQQGENFDIAIDGNTQLNIFRKLFHEFLNKTTAAHYRSISEIVVSPIYERYLQIPAREYVVLYYLYSSLKTFLGLLAQNTSDNDVFLNTINYGHDYVSATQKFIKDASYFLYYVNFPLYDDVQYDNNPLPPPEIYPENMVSQLREMLFSTNATFQDIPPTLNDSDAQFFHFMEQIVRCMEKIIDPNGSYPLPS